MPQVPVLPTVLGVVVAGSALAVPIDAGNPSLAAVHARPSSAAVKALAHVPGRTPMTHAAERPAPAPGPRIQADRVIPGSRDSGYFYGGLTLSGAAVVGGFLVTRRRER